MIFETPENVLSYRKRIIEKIKPYFYGSTLLDAGCGDGGDSYLLQDYFNSIYAVDIIKNDNWEKIKSEKIKFLTGNVEKLEFNDNFFDTVIEKDMLHHAENPEKALKELIRVSKKRIIVIEANRFNPIFYIHLTLLNGHQHFSQKKLKKIIKSCSGNFKFINFSARVCPINNSFLIKTVNFLSDLIEKLGFLYFFIEYNCAIIEKNEK